jgi:hypothetical protein
MHGQATHRFEGRLSPAVAVAQGSLRAPDAGPVPAQQQNRGQFLARRQPPMECGVDRGHRRLKRVMTSDVDNSSGHRGGRRAVDDRDVLAGEVRSVHVRARHVHPAARRHGQLGHPREPTDDRQLVREQCGTMAHDRGRHRGGNRGCLQCLLRDRRLRGHEVSGAQPHEPPRTHGTRECRVRPPAAESGLPGERFRGQLAHGRTVDYFPHRDRSSDLPAVDGEAAWGQRTRGLALIRDCAGCGGVGGEYQVKPDRVDCSSGEFSVKPDPRPPTEPPGPGVDGV